MKSVVILFCISFLFLESVIGQLKSFEITFDSTHSLSFFEKNVQYHIFTDNSQQIIFKKDSCGQWKILEAIDKNRKGLDTIAILQLIMNQIAHSFETQNEIYTKLYKKIDTLSNECNRWLNTMRWMCHDYGIDEKDIYEVLRKRGFNSINLNNKQSTFKMKL